MGLQSLEGSENVLFSKISACVKAHLNGIVTWVRLTRTNVEKEESLPTCMHDIYSTVTKHFARYYFRIGLQDYFFSASHSGFSKRPSTIDINVMPS